MLELEKVKTVTLAASTPYNRLREDCENRKISIPKSLIDHDNVGTGLFFECSWKADDVQGPWYPVSLSRNGNHSTIYASELREEYSEFFINEGCVPWQWKSARVDF